MGYRYLNIPTILVLIDWKVAAIAVFYVFALMLYDCIIHSLADIRGNRNPEGEFSVFYIVCFFAFIFIGGFPIQINIKIHLFYKCFVGSVCVPVIAHADGS